MGNRAWIVAKSDVDEGRGLVSAIYVHWFDRDALDDALKELRRREYRDTDRDPCYGMARLCQILCEQNPDGLNIGLTVVDIRHPDDRDIWMDVGLIAVDRCHIYRMASGGCGWLYTEYEDEEED